jgi:hypothetical protein
MGSAEDSRFFVLYSALHSRCGHFVERADFRVVTEDDLFVWSRDMTNSGLIQPLPLRCDQCAEDVPATHLRIIRDDYPLPHTVVPEVKIKHFNPNDWILNPNKHL